jgi:hypothetical protein
MCCLQAEDPEKPVAGLVSTQHHWRLSVARLIAHCSKKLTKAHFVGFPCPTHLPITHNSFLELPPIETYIQVLVSGESKLNPGLSPVFPLFLSFSCFLVTEVLQSHGFVYHKYAMIPSAASPRPDLSPKILMSIYAEVQ